jgi:hypothetical protein
MLAVARKPQRFIANPDCESGSTLCSSTRWRQFTHLLAAFLIRAKKGPIAARPISSKPPSEDTTSLPRRSLRAWFVAGFVLALVGMLLCVNRLLETGRPRLNAMRDPINRCFPEVSRGRNSPKKARQIR